MAYVLGYFVADGCISEDCNRIKNRYTFNITSADLDHLKTIAKVMESSYKIGKKFGSSGNLAYQIQTRNDTLANDLMSLGIYPRKTYNLGEINVPEKSVHQMKDKREKTMIQYSICFYVDDSEKLAKFMYGNSPALYLARKKKVFDQWKLIKRRNYTKENYPSKIGWHLNEKILN